MISDDIKRIDDDIHHLQNAKKFIQDNCPHENLVGTYKSDTGNWDRSNDSYWINFHCNICDKFWTEDQSDLQYDRIKGRVTKDGFKFDVVRN